MAAKQAIPRTSSRKRRLKPVIGRWLPLSPESTSKLMVNIALDAAFKRYDCKVRIKGRVITFVLTERK
jgi:hypothetical protein